MHSLLKAVASLIMVIDHVNNSILKFFPVVQVSNLIKTVVPYRQLCYYNTNGNSYLTDHQFSMYGAMLGKTIDILSPPGECIALTITI